MMMMMMMILLLLIVYIMITVDIFVVPLDAVTISMYILTTITA